ncbi:hypothetical protein MKW94_023216, partial [Papaver nudicaule]|nr:hypothetical protein [Papaver nudicaule]
LIVPTCRKKRIRVERQHQTFSNSRRNEDFDREKKELEEEFKRQMSEKNAEWERRMKAIQEEHNIHWNQMMEAVRLCRPDLFPIPGQFSGPSDHLFMSYRPVEQPRRPLEQPYKPLEQPHRPGEQLFQSGEPVYKPGDQLNILAYERASGIGFLGRLGVGLACNLIV